MVPLFPPSLSRPARAAAGSVLLTACWLALAVPAEADDSPPATATAAPAAATATPAADAGMASAPAGLTSMTADADHDGMGHLPGHPMMPQQEADEDGDGEHCDLMAMHHGMPGMHGVHGMHGMHGGMHGDPHEGMHGDPHHGLSDHAGMHGDDDGLAALTAPAPPAWLAGIELTPVQEDRIFAVLHEVAPTVRQDQRVLARTTQALRHIGLATDYTEAATRKLADEMAQAGSELARTRARTEKRILEILTPEQRRDAAHQAAADD